MSSSLTSRGNLTEIYSDLAALLKNLQTQSALRSFTTQTSSEEQPLHIFFLAQLPGLLTTQKSLAIHNLRKAYICVTHLSSSAEESVKTRYINFGRALLWALDYADDLLHSILDAGDPKILTAVGTIFHLVASLCHREWGIDQPSLHQNNQLVDASPDGPVCSTQDPVYHPPPRVKSQSTPHSIIIGNVSKQTNHDEQFNINFDRIESSLTCASRGAVEDGKPSPDQTISIGCHLEQVVHVPDSINNGQNDDSAQSSPPSDYIRNNGKYILPVARIMETSEGCHVPFELHVQDDGDDEFFGIFGLLTCHVRVRYPDNTCLSYIPVHDIRVRKPPIIHGLTRRENFHVNTDICMDVSTKVYETIIERLKKVYTTKFAKVSHVFLTERNLQLSICNSRVAMKIPVLSDSFARIVHLLWFVERSFWEAIEMCEHDIFGCGLLQAEFVESLEGTRIVLSLAGVVVERNLLNYNEKIFELLNNVVTELC